MKRCSGCGHRFDREGWHCPACGWEPPRIGPFMALGPDIEGRGYDADLFPQLAALEAGNFWFRSRNRLIVWASRRHSEAPSRILEIGCGTGFVLAALADVYPTAELTGSELFSEGLPFAATRAPQAELVQMDARDVPFVMHFDLIGAFDVLEHIKEDETVLTQMYQALSRGGTLVLTVPQHPWLWSSTDAAACHVRRYTADELRCKVKAAGFRVCEETSFVSLLLPLMMASRLRPHREYAEPDPLAELRICRVANVLLSAVMRIEHWIFRVGVRFPVGGSRLMIAKKD